MSASGLRREAAKGKLVIERIAGKDYTTLAAIEEMRKLCRIDRKVSGYGCEKEKGKFNQERLTALLTRIRDWNIFLAFNIIDGCTEGKSREPLQWLFQQVSGKVQSQFTEADIL